MWLMARRKEPPKRKPPKKVESPVFLPDHLDQVRAIAMRGLNDVEMAQCLGINPRLMKKWKEFYPGFEKALEQGRTEADARVVEALFHKATGYQRTRTEERVVGRGKNQTVLEVEVTEHFEPDTQAIKYWLSNRAPEHWKERREHSVGGSKDNPTPLGIRQESKLELMSSILSLIQPKPDEPQQG